MAYGGTGVGTLTGIAYGNGTANFSAATAAQIVSAISTNYVANATYATSSGSINGFNNPVTASTASTIAYRDSAGDLNVRLLRAEFANEATISGAIAFRVNNTTDNYTRYCSDAAAIRTFLGTDATGASRPASDVSAWAKAVSKPTYTASEVGAIATGGAAGSVTGVTLQAGLGTTSTPTFADVTITSDEKLKTNWRMFDTGVLQRLATVKRGIYDRLDIKKTQVGISANDFENVVMQGVTEDENGHKQISQSATLALLSELTALVLAQGQRIAELEAR